MPEAERQGCGTGDGGGRKQCFAHVGSSQFLPLAEMVQLPTVEVTLPAVLAKGAGPLLILAELSLALKPWLPGQAHRLSKWLVNWFESYEPSSSSLVSETGSI